MFSQMKKKMNKIKDDVPGVFRSKPIDDNIPSTFNPKKRMNIKKSKW